MRMLITLRGCPRFHFVPIKFVLAFAGINALIGSLKQFQTIKNSYRESDWKFIQ